MGAALGKFNSNLTKGAVLPWSTGIEMQPPSEDSYRTQRKPMTRSMREYVLYVVFNRTYALGAFLRCFARLFPRCIGNTAWSQASLAPQTASKCVSPI
ncbi:MAG: hypothetical protein G01um101448_453 [Parcubacteria group bacterium Gr01-1014_48]|nr:MAG: hypothetical protein Greene041614_275 [Parcubacteria group bacterium Greene0416_14]TSC73905.1 MAG: hypothetical protein G01um101448_453 [Parcubacteria group bacterium Gr01-1014_48]TSD00306.1 MAG: hypothetical protein Greene101415_897 [Parcubacteria group bacterium Greene1014_15]